MVIKIIVYARLDKSMMFEKGKAAGLSDDAANFFSYFEESKLALTVEKETGKVVAVESFDI